MLEVSFEAAEDVYKILTKILETDLHSVEEKLNWFILNLKFQCIIP